MIRTTSFSSAAFLILLAAAPLASAAGDNVAGFGVNGDAEATTTSELVHFGGAGIFQMEGSGTINWGEYFVSQTNKVEIYDSFEYIVNDPVGCDLYEVYVVPTLEQNDPHYCAAHSAIDYAPTAHLVGSAIAESFQIRLYGEPGAMEISANAERLGGRAATEMAAPGGSVYAPLKADAKPDTHQTPNQGVLPFFATRSLDRSAVLLQSANASGQVTVSGNFTIEIAGLRVASAVGTPTETWTTGWEDTSAVSNEAVTTTAFHFLRFSMSNASFSFDLSNGNKMDVAANSMVVKSNDGSINLHEAIEGDSLDSILNDDAPEGDWDVPAPYVATIVPFGEFMLVSIDSSMATGPEAPSMFSAESRQIMLWIAAAALFAGAIAAVVIRSSTSPPLPVIEAALEGGRFRKAARMASRVLRRDPTQESAQLARAIAWSRMGAHDRIIQHLEPFLRQNEPSDGTIHYVLGLAHHEMGQEDEAREAMSAAVKRTPSLLTDVDPSLRMTDRSPTGYS